MMARLSTEERLDIAIKTAAQEALPSQTSQEVAERLYEDERVLMDHFAPQWIIEKLASLVRKHRERKRKPTAQTVLGFRGLPRKITLKDGEVVPLRTARLWQLRQYRAQIFVLRLKHPQLEQIDKAIELVKKYAQDQRRVTFAEACEKEIEKS